MAQTLVTSIRRPQSGKVQIYVYMDVDVYVNVSVAWTECEKRFLASSSSRYRLDGRDNGMWV